MKNKFLYIVALCTGLMCSCNEIDENDRFLDYKPVAVGEKNVLLEEFTGWRCVNCPEGAAEAKRLQESYDHHVVLVSIHAGGFSIGSSYVTEAGKAFLKEFYSDDRDGYPAAMVNRKKTDGKYVSTGYQKEWSEWVKKCFEMPVYISLTMEATYDAATRNVIVTSKVQSTAGVENAKLQILLTENKIIGRQLGEGGGANYEHNHMLRGVIGDKDATPNYWGKDISILTTGEKIYESDPYTLAENWVSENMNLVGVIYNAQTKEVMQVAEIKLIKEQQ